MVFDIQRNSVNRIWKQAKQQVREGQAIDLQPMKTLYQHIDRFVLDAVKVKALPPRERSTYRKLAANIKISKSQVGRYVKSKQLRAHTSVVKPLLTEANKIGRLKFSLSHLMLEFNGENKIKFQNMKNVVHVDEKYFYMKKNTNRFYLLPDEEYPYRSYKSKRFIPKIMFMCAVSRPHFEGTNNVVFDGKIGIFSFIDKLPVKIRSKNRENGTLETKATQSSTKEVVKQCILNEIIPTIKAKYPEGASKHIYIHLDNAKPHFKANDPDFVIAANTNGFNVQLICQPANSPDTNINDLGFFRAIQSIQDDKRSKNYEELTLNVKDSFEELTVATLNNVFLTLQSCYIKS